MSEQFTVFYPMPQEGVANYFIENGSGVNAKVDGPRSPDRDRFISDLLKPHKYHERLVEALRNTLRVLEGGEGNYSINRDRKLLAALEAEKGGEL